MDCTESITKKTTIKMMKVSEFYKSVKVFPIKIKYFMETIAWMSVFSLHFNLGYHSDKKIMLPM